MLLIRYLSNAQPECNNMPNEEKISRLKKQLAESRKPRQQVTLLNDLAMELHPSDPAACIKLAAEALELARKIQFKIGIARSHFSTGMAHFKQARYLDAFAAFQRANDAYRQAGDRWGESNALNHLGLICSKTGNSLRALDYFTDSLRIKEETEDEYGKSNVLISIAGIHHEAGKTEEAKRMIGEALAIAQHIRAEALVGKVLYELGNIHCTEIDFNGARSAYTEALNYFEKQSDKSGIAQCRLKLGRISLETGDVNSAHSILHSAMEYALQVGDKSTEANILVELAKIEWMQGHRAEAIVHLERARGFAEANQERPLLIKILQELSEAHEAAGEFEVSLANLKKAVRLSSEVNFSETTARLHDMEMNRKFELLERENRLMEIENQLALAEVRRRISSDLHDDIGAALSGFSIYSTAIRNNIMQGNLDEAMDSIDNIGEESRELLERLSDIVWAINPKNDRFDQLVSRLQNYASRICSGKNIDLNFAADTSLAEELLPLETRSNLFLILKEAINNAAKYSCATHMNVSLNRNEQSIIACVEDDGRGFDPNTASGGNGLRNMKQRAALIRASFDLQSTPEVGTRIVLEIPL